MKRITTSIFLVLLISLTSGAAIPYWDKSEPVKKCYATLPLIAQNQENVDLEFVKTEAFKSKDGKHFHVKGFVKNISTSKALKKVTVTVIIYDKDNKELEKKTVSTSPDVIKPGGEASYEVITKYHENMRGYEKTAKWKKRRW